MKKLLLLLTFVGFYSSTLISQEPPQPSMMILPYTQSGESALDLYQSSEDYRALIIGMEQAFIDNGAELRDLERLIINAKEQMTREANKYIDINDAINRNATTDITIAPEINYQDDGSLVQFGILMKALDTSTGAILYTGKYISTPSIPRSSNMMDVATNILKYDKGEGPYLQIFLAGMRRAFEKMVNDGRLVKIIISTDDNSDYGLSDEANDDFDLIRDVITEFIEENSMSAAVSSSSDNRMEFDVKIAVRDSDGKPYNLSKFAKSVRKTILRTCVSASKVMGDDYRPDPKSCQENIDKGTYMITMPSYRE